MFRILFRPGSLAIAVCAGALLTVACDHQRPSEPPAAKAAAPEAEAENDLAAVPPPEPVRPQGDPAAAAPAAPVDPQCARVAAHVGEVATTAGLEARYVMQLERQLRTQCTHQRWSDQLKACLLAAKDEKAYVACDVPAPTPPPYERTDLSCEAVASHMATLSLAVLEAGDYTEEQKSASSARLVTTVMPGNRQACEEEPWSAERRKCVMAADEAAALRACEELGQEGPSCGKVAVHVTDLLQPDGDATARERSLASVRNMCESQRFDAEVRSCILAASSREALTQCHPALR